MSHTQSGIAGATLLRWMSKAALLGLLAGVAAGIASLATP